MDDKITVEYFTDPLCPWSYAFEDSFQKLLNEYKEQIDVKVRLTPIMDRLASEADPEQKILSPEFLKDEWQHVSKLTDVKMNTRLLDENPPHSSWPACRAVKAAERQGQDVMIRFLHNFRESIFQQARNPSNLENLKEIAGDSGLDVERFYSDMTTRAGDLEEMVNTDAQDAAAKCVESTPTLLFHSPNGDKVTIAGPMDYNLIKQTMVTLMSELKAEREKEVRAAM